MTDNKDKDKEKDKKKGKDTIDVDDVLMKIWCIIKKWDDILLKQLIASDFKSMKDFQNKSLYSLFELVSSINWNNCNKYTTRKMFLNEVDELRKNTLKAPPSQVNYAPNYGGGRYGGRTRPVRRRGYRSARRGSRANRRSRYRGRVRSIGSRGGGRGMSIPVCRGSSRVSSRGRGRGRGMSRGGRGRGRGRGKRPQRAPRAPTSNASKMDQNIGFSVGGAMDINAFRDSVNNNQMPQLNAITFEGIYSEYYFDTNADDVDNIDDDDDDQKELPLFYPSYSYSKSLIPDSLLMAFSDNITKKTNDMIDNDDDDYDLYDFHINSSIDYDYFMTVGLNSNMKLSDFNRKKLNLVIVLDISGSMASGWNMPSNHNKMKTANECILSLLTHLKGDDRFGLVLFDHTTRVHIAFKQMSDHNIANINSILGIRASGGTDFELGYNAGLGMFNNNNNLINKNISEYENRIIMLTDACPNIGATDPNSLMNLVKKSATNANKQKQIFTTFVGIGLDFNADLVSEITKVRGANYFAVHSSIEFFQKLDFEFDYFISPMVFDLKLTMESEGNSDNFCIDNVYGSNDIDIKSGEIMKINTLFPSPPNDYGEIKGGIVLIKLKKNINIKSIIIKCEFENKFGKIFQNKQNVILPSSNYEYYPNLGIRKGILLTRYVVLLKQWISGGTRGYGSIIVNDKYKQIFQNFITYFKNEMNVLKDKDLKQELDLLTKLIKK